MALKKRYLEEQTLKDLSKKMVFLGGPRQVGKTYFSKRLPGGAAGYLNWDHEPDQSRILDQEFPKSTLWVFDEIHKYKRWRNFIKGIYDVKKAPQQILVTGSARLDLYSYGGDSLQGRYHFLRMHPLSFAEIQGKTTSDLLALFNYNGFPEPFFSQSKTETNRWSIEYRKRLIREDVKTLERVEDLLQLELLQKLLPERVASPLSLNSLREDLQVAHATVKNWVNILERMYAIFRITPYGYKLARAVKKEQKHYHFDWNLIEDPGARFENMIACHLKKWIDYQEDCFGVEYQLQYFRDTDSREVDFLITKNNQVIKIIECKMNDESISNSFRYLLSKNPEADAWQISLKGKKDYLSPEGIRVAPAIQLLKELI